MTQATTEPQEVGVYRSLISRLSEDLSWLEKHSRDQGNRGEQANRIRYGAGLIRNCLGPYLNDQPATPLHICVVGGAGAGKSTVANLLVGAVVAEANPQAGFTRHPTAYTSPQDSIQWPAHLNFLEPLQRINEETDGSLDKDVYRIRKVDVPADAHGLLGKYVVWDCPDMTAWVATGYIPRLIEVAALADVVVYVASDERYNDLVPTEFLKMLVESKKPVLVVLTKMQESNAPAFVDHFKQEVLGKMEGGQYVPCLTIPYLNREELADPIRHARRFQIPLSNQAGVMGDPPTPARKRTIQAGLQFLIRDQEKLMGVAREDLRALNTWQELIRNGQTTFNDRYAQEYLATEKFHRFDAALVKLLELLELPGVGKFLSQTLYVVRTPYRLLKGLFTQAMQRPDPPTVPERPVLERAINGWLDQLQKEALNRGDSHGLWMHINQGFATNLREEAMARFEQGIRSFQGAQGAEIEQTARAIYEDLEKNPVALNSLRGSKFALEAGSIVASIASGGLTPIDLVWAPLAASISHQLVETLGKSYVNSHRERARQRQQTLVAQNLSGPLAGWLIDWPATGGSAFERLQTALKRIPQNLIELEGAIRTKMTSQ